MSQLSEGAKAAGWILATIGLIQFIVFLRIEIYFLLCLPIILLLIGVALIGTSLNEDKKSATV